MALSGRVILFTKTLLKNGIKRNSLVFPSGKRLFRSLRPVGVVFAEKKNYLPSVCNYSTDQLELLEESVLTKRWLPEDELLSLIEGFANKSSIPTCLYPESSDPILQAIISSTTTEQVFSLCSSQQHLNHEQASQALCSLWDLHHLIGSNLNPQPGIQANLVAQQLNSFIQNITTQQHTEFQRIVDTLVKSVAADRELLSDEVLVTVLLCLRKFRIAPWSEQLHPLLRSSLDRIDGFTISSLSKWCMAIKSFNETGRLIIPAAFPALEAFMKQCRTLKDARMISTCFITVAHLLNKKGETASNYTRLLSQLLDNNVINRDTPLRDLVKFLRGLYFLAKNNPESLRVTITILSLINESPGLDDPSSSIYFSWIRRSWEVVGEPIGLVRRIELLSCRWLENVDVNQDQIDLLNQVSYHASTDRRSRLEHHLAQILRTKHPELLEPHLKYIFRIIRHSKISNSKVVDAYWNTVIKCLEMHKCSGNGEEFKSLLLDAIQWYMFFNNNLGGTYRLNIFEHHIINWVYEVAAWDKPVLHVRSFCRLASFVLAYGSQQMPIGLVNKLHEMEDQLCYADVFLLSRGIRLGRSWHKRYQNSLSNLSLIDLSVMLDHRSAVLLSSNIQSNTLNQSTILLHAALYRNGQLHLTKDALSIYDVALRQCESQLNQLNGRLIRDIVFFLTRCKYTPMPIVDRIISYVLERHEGMSPSILVNVLILCFELGYVPNRNEALASVAAQSLAHKGGGMYGLFVLECALALMLPNRLPMDLVNEIFSIRFLDKLDAEVASCYSQASYPARVRRTLMELNRGVCIDMPEANIPWFHEKYCRERIISTTSTTSSFQNDIHQCLKQLLGSGHFIKSQTHSPYYHTIDFELRMDRNGVPLAHSDEEVLHNSNDEKIAILALMPTAFTANCQNLTGMSILKKRQLEILGYRVVAIPYHQWNSLALSNPQAKGNFLKHKLNKSTNLKT